MSELTTERVKKIREGITYQMIVPQDMLEVCDALIARQEVYADMTTTLDHIKVNLLHMESGLYETGDLGKITEAFRKHEGFEIARLNKIIADQEDELATLRSRPQGGGSNYIADDAIRPRRVDFDDGRVVSIATDDSGSFLRVEKSDQHECFECGGKIEGMCKHCHRDGNALRARAEKAEADLKLNAAMLARQTDMAREAELAQVKAEAEAAAKQNILNAIECNAAEALCDCEGCDIYTLAHGSDECANKTCPVMLRGIELAKEHAAKFKAMKEALEEIAREAPLHNGHQWALEIACKVIGDKP